MSVQRCGLVKPTLGEAGIDKNLAHRARKLYALPLTPCGLASTRLIGPFFLRTAHVVAHYPLYPAMPALACEGAPVKREAEEGWRTPRR